MEESSDHLRSIWKTNLEFKMKIDKVIQESCLGYRWERQRELRGNKGHTLCSEVVLFLEVTNNTCPLFRGNKQHLSFVQR